jgi:hypothetical protein
MTRLIPDVAYALAALIALVALCAYVGLAASVHYVAHTRWKQRESIQHEVGRPDREGKWYF